MPDSYVRWLEFQHTPLPNLFNNSSSNQVHRKLSARNRNIETSHKSLQVYHLMAYGATESCHDG